MAKAYLIGAGPGDPGLITVKGQRLLQECEVVIYDYLASKTFLSLCRPDAEIIYVGKKGGDHTLPQEMTPRYSGTSERLLQIARHPHHRVLCTPLFAGLLFYPVTPVKNRTV